MRLIHIVFLAALTGASGLVHGESTEPAASRDLTARPGPPALRPVVREAIKQDLSPPIWLIRPSGVPAAAERETHRPFPIRGGGPPPSATPAQDAVALEAGEAAPAAQLGAMPPPLSSFDGVSNRNGVAPPDTVGAVGRNHVVEWVNLSYAVYDRQGNLVSGPFNGNALWSGFGGICETRNSGDPIVLYDHLADRWLMSQFAFDWPHNFHQCVAVSQTPDPTGAWYRYDFFFDQNKLNDYPKFGVWPDAYYLAVNQFDGATQAWRGQGVLAFDRAQMLVGGKARLVYFDLYGVNPNYGGQLPSDVDGPLPPPPGAPNVFVEVDDGAWWGTFDRLSFWKFRVDWADPSRSTFGVAGDPDFVLNLSAAGYPFDSNFCGVAGGTACVPQPTGARLDPLADRLMYRLSYRNTGTYEALTVNHTVDADGLDHAGVRWYEIRDPGGTPTLRQAGTYAPDADNRWMGSAAMDGAGNIAVGYSVSSTVTPPSIRYAGRLASDPLGTLPQAEASLVTGGGAQTGLSRWGDYSTLVVDPTDDCTFWYFGEYYSETASSAWRTRFGSFRFDGCVSCPQLGRSDLAVERDPSGTRLSWTAAVGATTYDAAEGSLSVLQSSGGDFAAATNRCPAAGVASNEAVFPEADPAAGDGFWYLVRGVRNACRATYDDGAGSQVSGRDGGLNASVAACP